MAVNLFTPSSHKKDEIFIQIQCNLTVYALPEDSTLSTGVLQLIPLMTMLEKASTERPRFYDILLKKF